MCIRDRFYGFYWDPTYYLVIIGSVICLLASLKVRSTYAKYSHVRSMSGMTGRAAAEALLRSQVSNCLKAILKVCCLR